MVKSGQAIASAFFLYDASGALASPDSGPDATLYVNGTLNGAAVFISRLSVNPYIWLTTLPALNPGDVVQVCVTATIAGIATAGFVWNDVADTLLTSDVDTVLTAAHGAGAWGASAGAFSKDYTVTIDGLPGADVYCRMTSDVAGLANVDAGTTDSLGVITFHHNLPVGTPVWIWRTKTGVSFTDPDPEVI